MTYDLLSNTAPPMPRRLPSLISHTISKVPDYMRPAAANAIFPPIAAQMHDVTFRYADNCIHEPTFMEGCIAPSGVGKGYLDPMIEAIIRFLRLHDEESSRKLAEYARLYNKKGKNQDKPDRPLDAAILVPEPDMTNPALIQILQDAEREGNRSIYTLIPEIDLLDQCCGGHKKVTKVIRLNFDTKRYGAQRATVEGVSGNPRLRWRFNFSCVEAKAQKFFNDCLLDGTLGRIGCSYITRPTNISRGTIPHQGDYDDKYLNKLDEYLIRLRAATGEVNVPKICKLICHHSADLAEIADLSDDDSFQSLCNRSLNIAWLKGCILYIAEGYRWSKDIADFVEWSLYYDLWSKIAIFAPQLKKCNATERIDVRKYGPANMLDMLPDTFSREQLEQLRKQMDKSVYCTAQLNTWMGRQYITLDTSTELYSKTPDYLSKHPNPN